MIRRAIVLSIVMFASGSLWAKSPADGIWKFAMSSQMGSVDATVTLETNESTLTGKFDLGSGRTWEIEDGIIDGNTISFKINRDGASMTYVMDGTVMKDKIEGSASALGSVVGWTMNRQNQ